MTATQTAPNAQIPSPAAEPLLVSDREQRWYSVGPMILGGLGILAAVAVATLVGPTAAVFTALAGAGLLVIGFVVRYWQVSRRAYLAVTPEGFVFTDRHGERAYADADVVCMSCGHKPNYSAGILKSYTRTLTLWVEGRGVSERLVMRTTLPLNSLDPLDRLMTRIADHLYKLAEVAVREGHPVEGEGWSIERKELLVENRLGTDAILLSELVAVDVFDNHICVWKRGEPQPIARVPVESANAHLLPRLLKDYLPPPSENGEPPSTEGLGRILFERRSKKVTIVVLWCCVALFLLLGGTLIVLGLSDEWGVVVMGIVFVLLGLMMVLPAIGAQTTLFRCMEYGVSLLHWRGERKLRYTEVESFTYQAIRMYQNGVYTGTNLTLRFTPVAGVNEKPIKYHTQLQTGDEELDQLRDHISKVIAARMLGQLVEGQPVVWMDHLRIQKEGLEYRPKGFFGRKETMLIPYETITAFDIDTGVFRVWVQDQKKSVVNEAATQPNFFPGYFVLCTLFQGGGGEIAPAASGS